VWLAGAGGTAHTVLFADGTSGVERSVALPVVGTTTTAIRLPTVEEPDRVLVSVALADDRTAVLEATPATFVLLDVLDCPIGESCTFAIAAVYGGSQTVETFESGWDNDSYPLSFAGGDAAQYDGSAPQAFEDFEQTAAPQLCTVVPSTDRVIAVGHGLLVGEEVSFTNELGQLPAGLVQGAPYYVRVVHDADEFDVAPTAGGTVVDILDYGLGTHYVLRSRRQYWVADA
jgi:hypothetical protein